MNLVLARDFSDSLTNYFSSTCGRYVVLCDSEHSKSLVDAFDFFDI
jgi:hypothetical protein